VGMFLLRQVQHAVRGCRFACPGAR
jgi:hypothetical protein